VVETASDIESPGSKRVALFADAYPLLASTQAVPDGQNSYQLGWAGFREWDATNVLSYVINLWNVKCIVSPPISCRLLEPRKG
jgi:hypothetical protein